MTHPYFSLGDLLDCLIIYTKRFSISRLDDDLLIDIFLDNKSTVLGYNLDTKRFYFIHIEILTQREN